MYFIFLIEAALDSVGLVCPKHAADFLTWQRQVNNSASASGANVIHPLSFELAFLKLLATSFGARSPRIRRHFCTAITALSVLLALAATTHAITWTTIDYPGADISGLLGVDGDNFVGGFSIGSGFTGSGFRYDGATYTPLDYPGDDDTLAAGIDGANVVGYYDSGNHGFLYDGATWTSLDYPGAAFSEARGISGTKIVGLYGQSGGGVRGYLYDGATWTTLQHPDVIGLAGETSAFDVDGDNIVGDFHDGSGRHGFLYNGATWTTLSYPGADATTAYGIDGENIVGIYEKDLEPRRGFLYDGTTWTTLDYPGAQETFAHGISGNRVVGTYIDDAGIHGFIATILPNPADLNLDGFVDGLDLGILLGNFNTSAAPNQGELNGTPPVDGLDLGILLGAWNPPAALLVRSQSVPEPTAMMLLLVGATVLVAGRKKST